MNKIKFHLMHRRSHDGEKKKKKTKTPAAQQEDALNWKHFHSHCLPMRCVQVVLFTFIFIVNYIFFLIFFLSIYVFLLIYFHCRHLN